MMQMRFSAHGLLSFGNALHPKWCKCTDGLLRHLRGCAELAFCRHSAAAALSRKVRMNASRYIGPLSCTFQKMT